MKLNISCKVGVYSNPIKITFNNQSKILTDNNSGLSFDFDADTEYELTIEQIHKDKESVPTRVTNIVLNIISHYISASAKMEKSFDYVNYGGVRPYLLCNKYTFSSKDNCNIEIDYTDSMFIKNKKSFTKPSLSINSNSLTLVDSNINLSLNELKQRKTDLTITLSVILILSFLILGIILYVCFKPIVIIILGVVFLALLIWLLNILNRSYKRIVDNVSSI
ncbi:MAG: hypothetical protein PUE26_03640 [Ruminococcus sp.]|nr:hypothetical protein [Ruminococcus sp.]MDD6709231.1 hypothetical protein [Ruminococcus sp.]